MFGKRSNAIGSQVQKHLHETGPISPHEGQAWIHGPIRHDILLLQRWGNNDFQLIEQSGEVDLGSLIARLPKIDAGDAFECDDKIAKRFEILAFSKHSAMRKISMNGGNGAGNIANFVGNGADSDPGSGKQLV